MGLAFLAPLFLAGLAAVAIPILVHLTHRESREVVRFPSLMFLRRVPYRTVRRQRIRHWLLFLLRAAAIVLLTAAFARPLLRAGPLAPPSLGSAREVVILLDRSYSMTAGDRWGRATRAARRSIEGLTSDDRAAVVLFADQAVQALAPTNDAVALNAAVENARPAGGRTRYGPALRLARDLLEGSDLPRREVVLITDFQRSGWEGDADLRLPDGTAVTRVDVGDDEASNVAVTGVLLRREPGAATRLTVTARLVNTGDSAARGLPVRLDLDGQEAARRTADLPAHASVTVAFPAIRVADRTVRGVVRADGRGPEVDDRFHFVVSPPAPVPILLVRDGGVARSELLYLIQALSLGQEPAFEVTERAPPRIAESDLERAAAVVVYDTPLPGGSVGERLDTFVRSGGGLLVVLGNRGGVNRWPVAMADALGTVGPVADRLDERGGTLSVTDFGHPIFAPFAEPRSGDFSQARFFRYHRIAPPAGATVLARFDDGQPALTALKLGVGHVVVLPTDLGNGWNDLPLQPVFLPFVHQLARYLARYRPQPHSFAAGQILSLDRDPAAPDWGPDRPNTSRLIVEAPNGNREIVEAAEDAHVTLGEPGFYVVRPSDGSPTDGRVVAVNPDVAEADLARLDPDELLAAIQPEQGAEARLTALAGAATPAELERRQGLWWYLLTSALLLLVAECVLAGRLSGSHR